MTFRNSRLLPFLFFFQEKSEKLVHNYFGFEYIISCLKFNSNSFAKRKANSALHLKNEMVQTNVKYFVSKVEYHF